MKRAALLLLLAGCSRAEDGLTVVVQPAGGAEESFYINLKREEKLVAYDVQRVINRLQGPGYIRWSWAGGKGERTLLYKTGEEYPYALGSGQAMHPKSLLDLLALEITASALAR